MMKIKIAILSIISSGWVYYITNRLIYHEEFLSAYGVFVLAAALMLLIHEIEK